MVILDTPLTFGNFHISFQSGYCFTTFCR